MKTLTLLLAFTAVAGTAFAQLSTLPPPSTDDGIFVEGKGVNAGSAHWDNPSALGGYKVISSTSGNEPITAPLYNPSGLAYAPTAPVSVSTIMSSINANGGTLRTIFVGESAGWQNDFGYTLSGMPAGPSSFTVWQNIQVNPSPATLAFGDHFDIPFAAGDAASFDLWLNGVGDFGLNNPPTPTQNGGVYTAFHPANSSSYVDGGNVRWAQSPLSISTYIPTLGIFSNVSTYLLGFGDWRLDRNADRDFTDLVVALQFFDANGLPFGGEPVPEPSTYGLIGVVALLGLTVLRRFKSKPAA